MKRIRLLHDESLTHKTIATIAAGVGWDVEYACQNGLWKNAGGFRGEFANDTHIWHDVFLAPGTRMLWA